MVGFVVTQARQKWTGKWLPKGRFEVLPLAKLTPKCIFIQRKWGDERRMRDAYFHRTFENKEDAESWVSSLFAAQHIDDLETSLRAARETANAAQDRLNKALSDAGKIAWSVELQED